MTGLTPLLHHVITVGLIWLAIIIIVRIIRWAIFNSMDKLQKDANETRSQKGTVNKTVSVVTIGTGAIALAVVVIFALFMYNPMERGYEEMGKITPATVDESFVEPTKEEIEASNKEVIEKKHREKEDEAERDNIRAMEEASELFRKAGEQAEK